MRKKTEEVVDNAAVETKVEALVEDVKAPVEAPAEETAKKTEETEEVVDNAAETKVEVPVEATDPSDFAMETLRRFPELDEAYVDIYGCVFTKDTPADMVGKATLYKNPYFNK